MSTLRVNTIQDTAGSGSPSIAGAAKAWVNFNGQGTVAIRASLNVSSITDNGTGNYFVNFTNAVTNGSYAVGSSFQRVDETAQFLNIGFNNNANGFAVEAFRAGSSSNTATQTDFATLSLTVFR